MLFLWYFHSLSSLCTHARTHLARDLFPMLRYLSGTASRTKSDHQTHACLSPFKQLQNCTSSNYLCVHSCNCMHVCVLRAYVHACVHEHTCVCVCACVCVCVYTCSRLCFDCVSVLLLCNGLCAPIWRNSTSNSAFLLLA